MSEESPEKEQAETDDWAAAMAEQSEATAQSEQGDNAADQETTDDWAAAMAEQSQTDQQSLSSGSDLASTGRNKVSEAPVFEEFSSEKLIHNTRNDIDLILDIPVQMTVELGRTKIAIKNLLQLAQGSVVELEGMAGEPMDVLVNGCLIAQGEVVVVNDKFGIRLTDIITPSERIKKLNR